MNRILFQLNLAKMRASFDDPLFDDFKVWLNALHALAEADPGFLWRYKGEDDHAGHIAPYPCAPLIMGNMSAWRDYDSLYAYTFTDGHLEIMKNKRKWFEPMQQPYGVLYYGDEDDLVKPKDELLKTALLKLAYLKKHGETSNAFGFGSHRGIL
tara:strand:- start:437 stop:898 length:462 start_codon:yes stop_codon:yes gene_type:complete